MSLPVVYQPSIASETDGTMRFLLQVIAIWSESKKPDIAEMVSAKFRAPVRLSDAV